MENILSSSNDSKKYKSWSKSSRSDEWTKEIKVEEIENGYLVCLDQYGEKDGEYKSEYKKYFSKENPLSDSDLETDNGLEGAIDDFIKNM